MTFLQQQLFQFQEKMKSVNSLAWPNMKERGYSAWKDEVASIGKSVKEAREKVDIVRESVKSIGTTPAMDDYEKRKLGIFNQINFFQLVIGVFVPLAGLFHNKRFPEFAWLAASLPAAISLIVLWLNAHRKHEIAIILYFIFYPVVTSIVYMSGVNVGVEVFFILYGILSVFFIQQISHMLFSVTLSMISYFMLAVVWPNHRFQLQSSNMVLYLFNEFAGIVFIFYGLFLIKKENLGYQASVLSKNHEIAENAVLLEKQKAELTELNNLKNKLFSVIAHDLKVPMYALRNVFRNIQQQNVPAKEIKAMLPDMVDNLNYTTGLLENLLQWAKTQMQSEGPKIQELDLGKMLVEVTRLLQLQAEAKHLTLVVESDGPATVKADKDMIDLVLRNLLSNALKFTPENGKIILRIDQLPSSIRLSVQDTGRGISADEMEKISRNDYFSTNGTAHEPGTGLGLMLCKEFLLKNGSRLCIESEYGNGSIFSFELATAGSA